MQISTGHLSLLEEHQNFGQREYWSLWIEVPHWMVWRGMLKILWDCRFSRHWVWRWECYRI